MVARSWCMAGALLGFSLNAFAQAAPPKPADPDTETNRGAIIPFLEGTDVFLTSDDGMVFEANIQPHLVVFQNFTNTVQVGREKAVSFSISGTPGVRIRMFETASRPVRTPSYQPRANVQVLWIRDRSLVARRLSAARAARIAPTADRPADELVTMGLWEGHLIVSHHSNGQDGCFFVGQSRDADGVCQPPMSFDPTQVNRRDGSFSTNFVRLGINYRRNWLTPADDGHIDSIAVREMTLRGDVEWHPRAWVDEDMVDHYGRLRLQVAAHWARSRTGARAWHCPKRLQAGGGLEYVNRTPDGVPHWIGTAQVSCFPTVNGGWGVFARVYSGQDYYNLGFVEKITRLHVGITYNPDDFFRFVRAQP